MFCNLLVVVSFLKLKPTPLNGAIYMSRLILGTLLIAFPFFALSHEFSQKGMEINHPWSKPTPPISKYGVAYFTITNSGKDQDRLLKVQIPPSVGESASLHNVIQDGDIVRMRELVNGKAIPRNSTVEFKPGGNHVMLEGLKKPLKLGEKFTINLIFEKAGEIPVEIWVEEGEVTKGAPHKH